MRVKKRVKKGVKKGIKSVKSAPPEGYLAGAGVLVGGAAVLILTTTKSGRELLIRTVQLTRRPEADEPESEESDVQDEAHSELAEDAGGEGCGLASVHGFATHDLNPGACEANVLGSAPVG